jgi:hypothetical protein
MTLGDLMFAGCFFYVLWKVGPALDAWEESYKDRLR